MFLCLLDLLPLDDNSSGKDVSASYITLLSIVSYAKAVSICLLVCLQIIIIIYSCVSCPDLQPWYRKRTFCT